MDLETQLRLSIRVLEMMECGLGHEDICVRLDIWNLEDRARIRAIVLRSSRADEGRAAGVAGIEAKARTGCPIIERVER